MSGPANKHKQESDPFLNFDTLVKQSISNKEKPAKETVIAPSVTPTANYAPNSRAQLVNQLMANNTHGLLSYDRAQFSTMYPKQPPQSYLNHPQTPNITL